MPLRRTYDVNDREIAKAYSRDQSYRNCICALVIFLFLCIILILACLPWKKPRSSHEDNFDYVHHDASQRDRKIITESTELTQSLSTTMKNFVTVNYDNYYNSETTVGEFERYIKKITDKISTVTTTTTDFETSNDSSQFSTDLNTIDPINHEINITENYDITTEDEVTEKKLNDSTTTDIMQSNSSTSTVNVFENVTDRISSPSETTQSAFFTTPFEFVTEEIEDEYRRTTSISNTSSSDNFTEGTTISSKLSEEIGSTKYYTDSTTSQPIVLYTTEEVNTTSSPTHLTTSQSITSSTISNSSPYFLKKLTNSMTVISSTSTSRSTEISDKSSTTVDYEKLTIREEDESNLRECMSEYCKQTASKMLSYMNHSADPCDDFYEYACGGMEVHSYISDKNLEEDIYKRIAKSMKMKNQHRESSVFSRFYNSCVQYNDIVNIKDRLEIAKRVLNEVGPFYTTATWPSNNPNILTDLFSKLILNHNALLFDVVPDLNDENPTLFTFKIGPPLYDNPFNIVSEDESCISQVDDTYNVDLEKLYEQYKKCQHNVTKFLRSVSSTLKAFDIFNELKNEYNITQYVESIVITIDIAIIKGFLSSFPTKDEIRKAYLMKNYSHVTVDQLNNSSKLINWPRLIENLIGREVLPEADLEVYFYNELVTAFQNIEKYKINNSTLHIYNALLAMYAQGLYRTLVMSNPTHPNDYCLRVSSNLLPIEAAGLYMASFSNQELNFMNETVSDMFKELKETLKKNLANANWAAKEGHEELLKKVDDLKLALPDIIYFDDVELENRGYTEKNIKLTDNYFENSIILLKEYRKLIYSKIGINQSNPQQIWTHYATPFQTKALAVYRLNLVIIPYGAIDWSNILKNNEISLDYLALATLGSLIAHQIAHHFDANGVHYYNGKRDMNFTLFDSNEYTKTNFEEYINCHKNLLYDNTKINMRIPYTGQNVSLKISQLSLNERLSENMGLRLAYDTIFEQKFPRERLPWLQLNTKQLFYLAYAQLHCSKSTLASSYVSLHENEQLPGRIRLFVTASNDKLLAETWKCPRGSPIFPSMSCNVFPYIDATKGDDVSSE